MASVGSRPSPTVSIIIPCFNRAELIGQAIESALRQVPDVDVIVVDDGSTDGSWDVISRFDGIESIRTANHGVSAARNTGLARSTSDYIKFLDSDDFIPDGSVKRMVEAAEGLGATQIAVGAALVRNESGGPPATYGYSAVVGPGPIDGATLLRFTMPSWLPLFPRTALTEAGGFDESLSIGEDYELAARLHARGSEFVQVAVDAYVLRDHADERLSRRYGATGYRNQLLALQTSWAHLTRTPGFLTTPGERESVGKVAWILARSASRSGHKDEAKSLFAFAREAGGAKSRVAWGPIKLLYPLMNPHSAERVVETLKALLRRRA